MNDYKQEPVHPGEILAEEFMKPLNISNYRLAKELNVPAQRIGDVVRGKRSISCDTALRLSIFFKTTPAYWLGLQMAYDLQCITDQKLQKIKKQVKPCSLRVA